MNAVTIAVTGTPAPQGSKRAFVVNGRAVVTEDSKKTKPWRQDVKAAALDAMAGRPPAEGPVEVTIAFALPRPGYHFGTGRNAGVLKATAPSYVDKKPDIDKLTRSTLDALTEAQVFRDDAQVAVLVVGKEYATAPARPGATITVTRLDNRTEPPAGDDTEQAVLL